MSKRAAVIFAFIVLVATSCGVVPGTGGGPKIGVVTDIGQLEDKSFNEFSWKGAQDGAKAINATANVIVTKDTADYAQNIQSFIDQKYDVIVTIGFLIGTDTRKKAEANPNIQFFGVDQQVQSPAPKNYQGLVWHEDRPGYLAGIVAANITKSNKIGAVGGRSDVPPVVAYIKGYENAAKKEKPGIQVTVNYVEDFNAPDKGEASARTMVGNGVDVIFQVAGGTGAGALRAACNAKIWGIGVDVDQYTTLPDAKACIVTSAEKFLQKSVAEALQRWKDKGPQSGIFEGGWGVSEIRNITAPAGLQDKLKKAMDDINAGKLDPLKP